jgi:hypothetical protein
MGHLAHAGDIPTITVMQRVTNTAFLHTTRVIPFDIFQTIWTAVFFMGGDLHLAFALK